MEASVKFTLRQLYPRYSLNRRLGGPHSRSGRFGGEKKLLPHSRTRNVSPLKIVHTTSDVLKNVLRSLDCSHCPTYAIVTFRDVRRKPEYSIHKANRIPINKGVQLDPNSITLKSERQLHDGPVASVIAQQHSSATFVSLHFNSRKENFLARFKNYYFNVILF